MNAERARWFDSQKDIWSGSEFVEGGGTRFGTIDKFHMLWRSSTSAEDEEDTFWVSCDWRERRWESSEEVGRREGREERPAREDANERTAEDAVVATSEIVLPMVLCSKRL